MSVDVPDGPAWSAPPGPASARWARRGDGRDVLPFVTHVHWDHASGSPFFEPLYESGRTIRLFPIALGDSPRPFGDLFDRVHFPVPRDRLASPCDSVTAGAEAMLAGYGVSGSALHLAYPSLTAGYRLEIEARAV